MGFRAELEVSGRLVVVCGGGAEALAAVRGLLDAGARVRVVADAAGAGAAGKTVADLAERGLVELRAGVPEAADLKGARLVVAATGSAAGDDEAVALAQTAGVLASVPGARSSPTERSREPSRRGKVTLVGGGPGNPGLLTVAGAAAVRAADVVVCDRLAPLAVLSEARPDAVVIDVAKIPRGAFTPQQRINEILVEHALAGRDVVRLKGGDSFVFGRGGEEWQACAAAGIPVTVIPGVSSALAAPALAGIPVTHRDLTQGFTVVSGHLPPGAPGSTLDWTALARANTTLIVMMGVSTLAAITARLVADGMPADTPAITIADAGLPSQRSVTGIVADIAARTAEVAIRPPAITVIGAVAGFDPRRAAAPAS